jgi:hypothetical protein
VSAQENLNPDQFVTLFHGTTDERAESIARTGFKHDYGGYGLAGKKTAESWGTMSASREDAASYTNTVERGERVPTKGTGSVVEFHVPTSLVSPVPHQEYNRGIYSVRHDIPPEYVVRVHTAHRHGA